MYTAWWMKRDVLYVIPFAVLIANKKRRSLCNTLRGSHHKQKESFFFRKAFSANSHKDDVLAKYLMRLLSHRISDILLSGNWSKNWNWTYQLTVSRTETEIHFTNESKKLKEKIEVKWMIPNWNLNRIEIYRQKENLNWSKMNASKTEMETELKYTIRTETEIVNKNVKWKASNWNQNLTELISEQK